MKKKPSTLRPMGDSPSVEELDRIIARQFDHLRAYRSRQDDVVRWIGTIQKFLELGSYAAAAEAMKDLLASDLKQAKDRQDNQAFALNMAIKTLERYTSHRDVVDVLSQLEILVPEAFDKTPAATGAAS